jgi:RimJ/RimL family protein N-acetyltransferase
MPEDVRIETERLRLRSWSKSDVTLYGQGCNTPAVMRWLGGVQTRRELKSDVSYFIKSEAAEGLTFWAVERKADEAFLGFCGLLRIRESDCPACGELEIGWRIREDVWRRGYAFEAATAVLDYAFGQRGIQLVVSRAAAGNAASRALMRKLGMRRDPALDYIPGGEDVALITYVIERHWAKIPHSRPATDD